MTTTQKEAIILLYPSTTQSMKNLRESLSSFCAEHNITIIDIINLRDEYDYLAIQRLSRIIRYSAKSISIITNRNILAAMPPLTLWSVLEAINSSKPLELTRSFLNELKESESKSDSLSIGDFGILQPKEVERMSDWLSDMHYAIMRDSANRVKEPHRSPSF